MRPLVSIITPSYNQASYLEYTIRSVLGQEYQPVEYLIVDGASTDGSQKVIQQYSDHLAWWVSEPDSGQSEAINKGLQRAKGEIVAWLNSDDLYLPGAIASAVAAFQKNPTLGLVFGGAITIDAQGRPINRLHFGDWGLFELLRFRIICQPTVFMRRSVLEEAGYLDPSYHFMLDHHLWIRIARLAPIAYLKPSSAPGSSATYRSTALMAAARHHPLAKNVAQATGFGEETMRLLAWMQTQSDLAPIVAENYKRVLAGAYRLTARYLLDGGQPKAALRTYLRALRYWPAYTLRHWHRMVYAVLQTVGGEVLMDRLRAGTERSRRDRLTAELKELEVTAGKSAWMDADASGKKHRLEDWPGICLEPL